MAEKVSKNRSTITNSLRLLKLSETVQEMLVEDMISTGHAKLLLGVEDSELQHELACKIFDEKLSVRETEKLLSKLGSKKDKKSKQKSKIEHSFIYKDVEEKLKQAIGSKVEVKPKDNKQGKIEISYYSQEELERISELLLK